MILWFTYPIVKALHEWCHGLAVKAWNGAVREIGLMLIIFMPIPYVDASSSYRFTSKWVRALVAATGVMAELFLGALAIYIWLLSEPGLLRAFAFNIILIAGVSTVLINGNPLMRYDGYYLLTDIIEIPNLSQRAKQYWTYLSDKYVMGASESHPQIGSDREKHWLFWYGLVAPIYRIVIIIGLIWFVAQKYFFLGVVIAIFSAFMSLIMPMWKGVKHVYKGNSLFKYRDKAKKRLNIIVLVVIALLTMLPIPYYSVQQGVVWLPEETIVRSKSTGHVQKVLVKDGQKVAENTPLIKLSNNELLAKLAAEKGKQEQIQLKLRQERLNDQAKVNELQSQLVASLQRSVTLQQDIKQLTVISQISGQWQPQDFIEGKGKYIKKGDILGHVLSDNSKYIRVAVVQDDMELIKNRVRSVEVKPNQRIQSSWNAQIIRTKPQGEHNMVSEALGSNAGGNILTDPSSSEGIKAINRVFDIELQLLENQKQLNLSNKFVYGDKVYVRFDLGYLPIFWQWALRLEQLFLKNFKY